MSKKVSTKTKMKVKPDIIASEKYVLRLFITGIMPNSIRAVVNCKALCEKYLENRYELEIIDIYQQPDLAFNEEIIAVPVLIKKFPLPEGRVIGDLSDSRKVLQSLDLI